MEYFIPLLFIGFVLFIAYKNGQKLLLKKRTNLIDSYNFPATINQKIFSKYPHLDEQDASKIIAGLRDYFHLCNIASNRIVSMPSQAVDVAWHEFILFTRQYEEFCSKALGFFLHHTPAEAMQSPTMAQAGIKSAWRIACHREKIDPKSPDKLPLLFAIDSDLKIGDGFHYSLDCKSTGNAAYCAGHIGCGSGCGGSGDDSGSDGCSDGGCGGD